MVWVSEAKRGALHGKEGDGKKVRTRRQKGRPMRRWMDGVTCVIKEKGLSWEEVKTT